MRLRNYAFLIVPLLLNFTSVLSDAPDKGRPFTQYYSPADYGAGSNNFNVVRDSLGVFYFSNDEGVLIFDGIEWSLIPINENKPVYWVEIDHKGTVLIASTGEIGYLDHLNNGQKIYRSLLTSGSEVEFENVWEIAVTNSESLFRSRKLLIHYQNGNVKTIESDSTSFDVAFTVKDTAYTRVRGKGLFYLTEGSLYPVPGGDFFANTKLNSYLPYEDKLLIGTRSGELFLIGNGIVERFITEADDFLKKYKIYDGCVTQSGNYAYSAPLKGVAILDKSGKLLQVLDETSGLPDHQYLFVGTADPTSLWMTHAVGISRAEVLSPVSYFDQSTGLEDVVTDLKIHNGQLYLTTLKGFYEYKQEQNEFSKINNNFLQEFHGITIANNQIFIGGQDGLMKLEAGKLIQTADQAIHEVNISLDENLIFAGSGEGGFDFIHAINGKNQTTHLEGFTEQVQKIIPFDNKIALVTLFGRLVMIDFDVEKGNVKYSINNEIDLGNFDAIKIENKLLIITPHEWSIIDVNGNKSEIGPLPVSNKISKIQTISSLKENSFWLCYKDEKRIEYCEKWVFKGNQLISTTQKFKPGYRINTIFTEKNGVTWFGGDEGVVRFDSDMVFQSQNEQVTCHISSTVLNNDSLISYYGFRPEEINLPYEGTSLEFNFYSNQSFSSNDEILFQYKLVGRDKNWSPWSSKSSKEYSSLNPNSYTFQVRAKNGFGEISEIESISFMVFTPWYLSMYSFFAYGLLIILISIGYTKWHTKKLKESKKRLEKLIQGRTIEVELQKQSLEEQRETLKQANASKDQLFSIIGHDLKAPLNSIQGITNLIKHYRLEKQPDKVDELMDHMNDSAKSLNHLLDNLLSWALNQSGNFQLRKKSIQLHILITEVIGVLKEVALAKGTNISTEVDEKLILEADANSLGTILRNLISNAIKFTNTNGNISIKAYKKEADLIIEIKDNGIGIPKDKMKDIFKLANTTYGTSNEKGTGLGLVLVQDFVELNGGKMSIESEVGSGSLFTLTFPSH